MITNHFFPVLRKLLGDRIYKGFRLLYRRLRHISFILHRNVKSKLRNKLSIIDRIYAISENIESPHTQYEVLSFIQTILSLPKEQTGVLVEAGCFKGSSTAKFSIAADMAGKELVVFDSFQGLPEHEEAHDKNIFGGAANFSEGKYCGTIDEVKRNVEKYGKIDCCRFVEGWFDETMPKFKESISAAYIDVDLVSSTKTCLKYLYPLLIPGGGLYSQDGHLPLIIEVLDDEDFWRKEVGCGKPKIIGLRRKKLVKIIKEDS